MEDTLCRRLFWRVKLLQSQKGDGGRDEQVLQVLVLLLGFWWTESLCLWLSLGPYSAMAYHIDLFEASQRLYIYGGLASYIEQFVNAYLICVMACSK
jgi:hypothetical protein